MNKPLLIGIIAFSIVLMLTQYGFADVTSVEFDSEMYEKLKEGRFITSLILFIPIPVLLLILIKVVISKDKKESVESND